MAKNQKLNGDLLTNEEKNSPMGLGYVSTADYSNFKNTVACDQQKKHDAYASVWHTMMDALGGYGRPPKQGKRLT